MVMQTPPWVEFLVFVQISFPVSYVEGCWNIWIKISITCSLNTVRKHNARVVWGLKFAVTFLRDQFIWDTTLCQLVAPDVWKEHNAFFFWACFGRSWPLQMKALPSLQLVETTSPRTQHRIPKDQNPRCTYRNACCNISYQELLERFFCNLIWMLHIWRTPMSLCFNFVCSVIACQMCGEVGVMLAPVAECSSYSKQY